MQHPTYDTLIRYIEHQLREGGLAAVEQHLALPCPQCRGTIARLDVVLQAAGGKSTYSPPAVVLRRAFSMFRKRSKMAGPTRRTALAKLVFDSWLQPSFAGVRGHVQNRQMLFRVGKLDIDLQITPERDDRKLVGQILGSEESGGGPPAFVSLTRKNGEVFQGAETDHFGQFAFRRIPSGTYDLVFDVRGQEIAITDLDLGNNK